MKRTLIRRKPKADPVHPELRIKVFERDQMCVAPLLNPSTSGPCSGRLTLDHVPSRGKNALGKRAPSDERHLVTLCWGHHIETNWGTSHRGVERWYLERLYGQMDEDDR
jgi:hypothetical protein